MQHIFVCRRMAKTDRLHGFNVITKDLLKLWPLSCLAAPSCVYHGCLSLSCPTQNLRSSRKGSQDNGDRKRGRVGPRVYVELTLFTHFTLYALRTVYRQIRQQFNTMWCNQLYLERQIIFLWVFLCLGNALLFTAGLIKIIR